MSSGRLPSHASDGILDGILAADGIGEDLQLSDKAIRALRPKEKPYKVTGGDGLYILVTKQGSRLSRFDYRFNNKRLTLSLGKFPDLGLACDAGNAPAAEAMHLLQRSYSITTRTMREAPFRSGSRTWKRCAPGVMGHNTA
jgi:hypothetical protein